MISRKLASKTFVLAASVAAGSYVYLWITKPRGKK